MSEPARIELVSNLAAQAIEINGDSSGQNEYLPVYSSDEIHESFFSEFSQVNGAFWALSKRLESSDPRTIDYFLKGCQPDSLSSVLESIKLKPDQTPQPLVVRYLTLLSINELVQRYVAYANATLLEDVQGAIKKLEKEELLLALQIPNKTAFLNWYKAKFLQSVAEMTGGNNEPEA
jgi:hypothetical protein